jgi:RNA polymerase sigma-70 factor (ECF subfamily)
MAVLYAPLVYRWTLRAGVRRHDSADVVQEVFSVVHVRIADFRRERPGDSFRGWLWGITRNKLREHFRQVARGPNAAGGSDALLKMHEAASPESSSGSNEGFGALCRRALGLVQSEFEPTTWQAFWKVVVDAQRPEDVASELGISINAVYLARSRVVRRLREALGED